MDEDYNKLVMECTNCHLQFYARELRVDSVSNTMVCANCFNFPGSKINIIRTPPPLKKGVRGELPFTPRAASSRVGATTSAKVVPRDPAKPAVSISQKARDRVDRSDYATFRCSACDYRFDRKVNFNGVCPYCSKNVVKKTG